MRKVKADKKVLVAANMELTDAEGRTLAVVRRHQKELEQQNQRLGKAIKGMLRHMSYVRFRRFVEEADERSLIH